MEPPSTTPDNGAGYNTDHAENDSQLQRTCAGTYAGIVEKLGYLKRLGVNAIELLPVHEFNELEYYKVRISNTYRFCCLPTTNACICACIHPDSHGAKHRPALRKLCF